MNLNIDDFRDFIHSKLSRVKKYLQEYSKELPKYLLALRHKLDHPLSQIHILLQQLAMDTDEKVESLFTPIKIWIGEDLNFLDLALDEIRTILILLTEKKREPIFQGLQNDDLKQRLTQIIQSLEEIKKKVANEYDFAQLLK